MSSTRKIQSLKSVCLAALCLLSLWGPASAQGEGDDRVRVLSDITIVRPFPISRDDQPNCREWKDNFQLLSAVNNGDFLFRIRVRDAPRSKCGAFARIAGESSQFLFQSSEPIPEMLPGPASESYGTGEWKIAKRINIALMEEQLNEDEIQLYRPADALTEAWDESCISVFDKIMVRDGTARRVFYLLALSDGSPFLRRFREGVLCQNWPSQKSASQYVATFDIDGGVLHEGAFFFDRSFGTFLVTRSRGRDFCVFIPDLGITYVYLSEDRLRQILASTKAFASIVGVSEQSVESSRSDSRDAAARLLKGFGECDKW